MLSETLTPLAPCRAAQTASTRAWPAARSAFGGGVCASASAEHERRARTPGARRIGFIAVSLARSCAGRAAQYATATRRTRGSEPVVADAATVLSEVLELVEAVEVLDRHLGDRPRLGE